MTLFIIGFQQCQLNFKLILEVVGQSISCEIALRWMSLDCTDDKSTLLQVMAWTLGTITQADVDQDLCPHIL